MTVWQLLTALAATPSVVVMAKSIGTRMSSSWQSRTSEIDYLRAQLLEARHDVDTSAAACAATTESLTQCRLTNIRLRNNIERLASESVKRSSTNCPKERE